MCNTENEHGPNAYHALTLYSEVGSCENIIPLTVLNIISRTCKYLHSIVQWRIDKSRKLREKWTPIFAPKLHQYLIRHPIRYTGTKLKCVEMLGVSFGPLGIRILDVEGGLFTSEYLSETRLAFANVLLLARDRIPFVLVMFVSKNAILSVEINAEDYVDTGAVTPIQHAQLLEKYGDEAVIPARYVVDLNLPTRINPIILGPEFIDMERLHFCIAPCYSTSYVNGERVTDICFDPEFVGDLFSHAIIQFKTVSNVSYDWGRYCLTFNGRINEHVQTTSLIRKRDEQLVIDDRESNAEILAVSRRIEPPPGMNLDPITILQIDQINLADPNVVRQLAQLIVASNEPLDDNIDEELSSEYEIDYNFDYQ